MRSISETILTELGWDESFHIPEANAENQALIEEVSVVMTAVSRVKHVHFSLFTVEWL